MDGTTKTPAGPCGRLPLADALQAATRDLHREAERSGILADILSRRATRDGYVLLLRNLQPVYATLERRLTLARDCAQLAALADPAVYRAAALASDLEALAGDGWSRALPLLPAAEAYAHAVDAADEGGLLGHAYTRYLGDLNGGQVLRRLLGKTLALGDGCLAFFDFPAVTDIEAFRRDYRDRFNRAPLSAAEAESAVTEAMAAFRHNIALSQAVQAALVQARL